MSAAQAVGTPAPAPEASAADTGSEAGAPEAEASEAPAAENLNALLAKRQPPKSKAKKQPEAKAEGPDDSTEESGDEPAEEGDEGAPEPTDAAPDPSQVTAEKLFADEALSTPEGLKRAREVILAAKAHAETRHRKFDRADIRLKQRARELDTREGQAKQFEGEVQRLRGLGASFMQKMAIIKGERTANPVAIMAVLDELAGGGGDPEAGRRLYEEVSIALARDGKAPEPTRAERELREQVAQIKRQREEDVARLATEREQFEVTQLKTGVAQIERNIGVTANNPATFPNIAALITAGRFTADDAGRYVGDLMQEAAEQGEPIDLSTAIGMLNERLAISAGRAPQGEPGSERPTPRPRNGAPRRASPTVLPSSADLSSGRGRPLTHEERLENLSRDPGFFEELGPGFRQLAGL